MPILKPLQDALGSRLDDLADDDFIFGGKKPMTKSRYQNAWLQYCIGIGHAHDSGKRYKTGKKSKDGAPLYKTIIEPDSPPTSSGMSSPARWYSVASARRSPRS